MDWLENAKRINEELSCQNLWLKNHLNIKSNADIHRDLSEIQTINFTEEYNDASVTEVLPGLLKDWPNIKSVFVGYNKVQNLKELAALDFGNVEELRFYFDGESCSIPLQAPALKKLRLTYYQELTPLEILTYPDTHINFSGFPNLEELDLQRIPHIEPRDIQNLHHLKKLTVSDSDVKDLKWLEKAEYQLDTLIIRNCTCELTGLESQSQLKKLTIMYMDITDTSPIETLENLEFLDLYDCRIPDLDRLNRMKVPKKFLTRRDREIASIHKKVRDINRQAVKRIRMEDNKLKKPEELDSILLKIYTRQAALPLETRLEKHIQNFYDKELKVMNTPNFRVHGPFDTMEYKALFSSYANEYYPFLQEKYSPGV